MKAKPAPSDDHLKPHSRLVDAWRHERRRVSEHGSRFERSVLTFGPLGRTIATLLVLLVLAWFVMFGGAFGLVIGAVVWLGWVMPRALRDIWRRAALPSTDLTQLRDETARQLALEQRPQVAHPVFDQEQPPPGRW